MADITPEMEYLARFLLRDKGSLSNAEWDTFAEELAQLVVSGVAMDSEDEVFGRHRGDIVYKVGDPDTGWRIIAITTSDLDGVVKYIVKRADGTGRHAAHPSEFMRTVGHNGRGSTGETPPLAT